MIYHFNTLFSGTSIGEYYNACCRIVPDEDWICLWDADVLIFTTFANYNLYLDEAIAENPTVKLFSCLTNRVTNHNQRFWPILDANNDILVHRWRAEQLWNETRSMKRTAQKLAGYMLLFSKKTWQEVGGFNESGIACVDTEFSLRCHDRYGDAMVLCGMYVFHYFRLAENESPRHLYELERSREYPPESPLVNIIVRTHDRPKYFDRCINSIIRQTYKNFQIHVIADTDISYHYAAKYADRKMVDRLIRMNPEDTEGKHGDYEALKRQGVIVNDKFRRFWYDLYLNPVIRSIKHGWIWIIDDDKEIPDSNILEELVGNMNDEDTVIVGRYRRPKNVVPEDRFMRYPFTRCQIDTSCILFHSKHREKAAFDGHETDDWRFVNDMCEGMKIILVEKAIVMADNNGLNGKTETT